MNPQDNNRDEEKLAFLLAATNKDAAPPDRAFLDRLRDQSTAAFQAAFFPQAPPQKRRRVMIIRTLLAASVAAAILIGASLFRWYSLSGAGLTLREALENSAEAQTLHVLLLRGVGGEARSEGWIKQPNQLRLDEPDGTYQVANGPKLWLVNEQANQVTPQASPYHHPGQEGIALLDLVGFSEHYNQQEFLGSLPVERVDFYGRDCLVYRTVHRARKRDFLIEAYVDATTRRLHFLAAKVTVRNGPGVPDGPGELVNLKVLAYDEAVPEEKFAVSDTLTEDGRVGKVTDTQGVVTVKPVMHERWTPVCNQLLLKPGDWLRTDIRGANAVAFRLVKQTGVVLGPGTLVEVIKPTQLRILQGELEATVPANATLELLGPDQQKLSVKGTQRFRLDRQQLVQLDSVPLWLKGFKGATANESLGSLIAKVDGRNEPLTVGYHKVLVDIRDQIARTVIEESFVNHTAQQLEGVFYFPLPQDASISGFGMWIGEQLVEADIVEKQRAREIYEIILSERRDPGLLEWSGGNLFKARVWPIFAHSEKRIKISYTQVLPLQGSRYRYSYGLQSELLRQHPLRELAIDVKVNSAVPLKTVSSPTHVTRTDQTAHSAHVEFSAHEYSPERDFEVVIEVDGRQSDVVLIPHRRGDDGYFMLQLTPPGTSGDWERAILPDGEPLQILILADTSASMDASQRALQTSFVAALLNALTSKDTINLAACDVDCDWVFAQPVAAEPKNITAALQLLANRTSLGWTNLDKAFASALKQCGPKTHVIYIGDGIVTTGDADPVAFGKRLRQLYEGKSGTCHAVAVGNTFEPAALKAIASLGSGSVRRITGEHGPQAVALDLLNEIAQPGLRDLKVEFKGLRTAQVYPQELPNIPAGTQQILLGRYLPEGRDQAGEVIVTGAQGGKPVRFSARVELKDAEQGNSFIPRLWARMHLDKLLERGASESTKDEIIALSEEYQIITPHTSFLVLESDADRERFKVKRRFQMRDGEKFFAQGRENANYELLQKQMKRAGNWRLGLRRSVLQELAGLGRDVRSIVQQPIDEYGRRERRVTFSTAPPSSMTGRGHGAGFYRDLDFDGSNELYRNEDSKAGREDLGRKLGELEVDEGLDQVKEELQSPAGEPATPADEGAKEAAPEEIESEAPVPEKLALEFPSASPVASLRAGRLSAAAAKGASPIHFFSRPRSVNPADTEEEGEKDPRPGEWSQGESQWLDTIIPPLGSAPRKTKEPQSTWPAPVLALTRSLLRADSLARMTGGIEIVRQTDYFDLRGGDLSSRSQRLELVSPTAWLTRSERPGDQTLVHWCDKRECGVFSKAFQFGRLRSSTPEDLSQPPLDLNDYSLTGLERFYANLTAALAPQGKDRALLVLRNASQPHYELRILVNTSRHVMLTMEHRLDGKITSATKFDDFVQVGGSWWARRIESTDDMGRRTSLIAQAIKSLTRAEVDRRVREEIGARDQVQFIRQPLPSVTEAKRALTRLGEMTFDVQLVLLLHYASSQQWTRVQEHLQQAEQLAQGKPGIRWLRYLVLNQSRRHEELKKLWLEEGQRLAKMPSTPDELFLAEHIFRQAAAFLQANEMLSLLDTLKSLYERQPAYVQGLKLWNQHRVYHLTQAGQGDEALRIQKQLATGYPHDSSMQQQYAQALVNAGDYPTAYAWLSRILAKDARWLPHEEDSLHGLYCQFLESQGRFPELAVYLADWVKLNPDGRTAYEQYLSALIRSDQLDKAHAVVTQWLKEGQVRGHLAPPMFSRLQAAINLALGQGHGLYTNHIEERWLDPLADLVLFFAGNDDYLNVAANIMAQGQFQQSDPCRRVRKTIAGILAADLDKLTALQIKHFVDWISLNDPAIKPEFWQQIAAGVRQRWLAETRPEIRNQLGQALVDILTGRTSVSELLAFLHLQSREGPESYRARYAVQLFEKLLEQPWSPEYEDEALAMLEKLSDADDQAECLAIQVAALYHLTDRMVAARFAALMKKVEHQEQLPRTELQKKKEENLRQARAGFSDRLRVAVANHSGPLVQWLTIERLYLETVLNRNLQQVSAECWQLLEALPQRLRAESEALRRLDEIARDRLLFTLANLTTRKNAERGLGERLLNYLDQAIAAGAEDERFQLCKYRLLIALDRPKDLEKALAQWIRADDPDSRWRLSLGYLAAEQGRIREAIKLLEGIEAADELGPEAYHALADWYLVDNRREQHDRALVAMYKTMEEWRLSNEISAKLNPWQSGGAHLPTELDKDVLLLFTAIFEKSHNPQGYLWQLQQFYQACRDFRLLAVMADAVVGHSAGEVYPFLKNMQSVLSEIRDEATADELIHQIQPARKRARTAVDERALDLLEVLVERRAAELKNQPGPHVSAALAAMQRAWKRNWATGEPRLMADLLASLGAVSQPVLAREQLQELEALHREQAKGSLDRLRIALSFATSLGSYGRGLEAIELLQSALKEFQDANNSVLPASANDALTAFVSYLESAGQHARAEKYLQSQLQHRIHQQQELWLRQQLYQLYHHALQTGGQVSLGAGQALYEALERKLRADLGTDDHNHRSALIQLLCAVYRTAHGQKREGVLDNLKTFAFDQLPQLFKRQTNSLDALVSAVAQTVYDLGGSRAGVAFLLQVIEKEPVWLRYTNQDGWSRHSWTIAQWREIKSPDSLGNLGDVEDRLLRLVVAELQRDLESRQARNRVIYARQNAYFWADKADSFAQTGEDVLAQRRQSGAAVTYIADYFYAGLDRPARAIEILLAAHRQKLLDEAGQWQLANYLQLQSRFAESIALLQALVEQQPETLHYRISLLRAYFHTNRQAELVGLLEHTDAFFHQQSRWNEQVESALALSCLENRLFARAVAYFEELIPLHERSHPRRGIGDGSLSNYYANLAQAYAGLHDTAKAVDAAGAAIISWGPVHQYRAQALETLKQVLRQAPDLDGYVVWLDKQSAKTGLYSPVVRKALGQIYFEKRKYEQAILQLQVAAELQPNDAETHQTLIACYDKKEDKEGAIRQLLQAVQLSRRDIKVYQELGRRLQELQQPKEVERAYTSIVEVLPQEAESHTLLAEIRQQQNRWSEAILHWQQVARIRALEPTGLLKLAAAQIHERQWDTAAQTLRQLEAKPWPGRFGDVQGQAQELKRQIEKGRKLKF